MIQARYLLSSLINVPLLPLLYWQAVQIRRRVPSLPEAKNPEGTVGKGTSALHLLALGESTIAGVGVKNHQEGFTGHLAQLLAGADERRVKWRVKAESGVTISQVRENLLPQLRNQKADLIVIGLGGNDTFQLTSPGRWRKQLRLLIDELQSKFPEAVLVFINMPPVRSFPALTSLAKFVLGRHLDLLHEVLQKEVANQNDVWFVEKRIRLKDWLNYWPDRSRAVEEFFSDGVHPSELTYQTWAAEVAKFIRERRIIE